MIESDYNRSKTSSYEHKKRFKKIKTHNEIEKNKRAKRGASNLKRSKSVQTKEEQKDN